MYKGKLKLLNRELISYFFSLVKSPKWVNIHPSSLNLTPHTYTFNATILTQHAEQKKDKIQQQNRKENTGII